MLLLLISLLMNLGLHVPSNIQAMKSVAYNHSSMCRRTSLTSGNDTMIVMSDVERRAVRLNSEHMRNLLGSVT